MVKLQYDGKHRYHITLPASLVRLKKWVPKETELDVRFNERGNAELWEIKK